MSKARDLANASPGSTGMPFRAASGTSSVATLAAGASSGATTVTFPASRFTAAPSVTGSSTSSDQCTVAFLSTTSAATSMYVRNCSSLSTGATVNITYIAIQMTSSSGVG